MKYIKFNKIRERVMFVTFMLSFILMTGICEGYSQFKLSTGQFYYGSFLCMAMAACAWLMKFCEVEA